MTIFRRAIQFVVECVVGCLLAGVVLGAGVPLLMRYGLVPPAPWNVVMFWGTLVLLAAAVTLRPKGSLRRRD